MRGLVIFTGAVDDPGGGLKKMDSDYLQVGSRVDKINH